MNDAASVYILRCADGSYCTGITRKPVDAQLREHNSRLIEGYTSTRTPVELVFADPFASIVDAIAMERRIKGWSHAKKEALIARDYERLKVLARNRQGCGNAPCGSTSSP